MDPITAIGLVSGILSFVSFSTKLIKGAVEIHHASGGTLEENRTSEEAACELERLAAHLRPPDGAQLADESKDLCHLAEECRSLAQGLIKMLKDIKPVNQGSKRQSLWAALRSKMQENDRKELEQKLNSLRGRLQLQLTFLTRFAIHTSFVDAAITCG